MTSPDGSTWTGHTLIADAGGGVVMAGTALAIRASHDDADWYQSPDASTWTPGGFFNQIPNQVAYSPELDLLVSVGFSDPGTIGGIVVSVPVVSVSFHLGFPCIGEGDFGGTVTPNTFDGDPVTWYFEYGIGSFTNQSPGGTLSGIDPVDVSETVFGIEDSSFYQIRLVAIHGAVRVNSSTTHFTVADCPVHPSLETEFSI